MKRFSLWHLPFLVFIFSFCLPLFPLFAQTFKPVLTKQYSRLTGVPLTVSDLFTACDPKGSFRIVVFNGSGGQKRISSGSIFVNGLEVIKEQDLNQKVERIERPLSKVLRDNRLEVRLRSGPTGALQVAVEGIQKCLGITITSPAPGTVINRSPVLVRGEVKAPEGTELGVTVNGVAGEVNGGEFAAFVPLQLGTNTITAKVVDAAGNSATDSTIVDVPSLQEDPLRLLASPSRGLSPLTVELRPSSLLGRRIVLFELDFEGDGIVDLSSATFDRVTHVYAQERLFFPTLTVTDDLGNKTSAATIVNVFALPDLAAKWNAMKGALRNGDIDRALQFIAEQSRERYRGIFTTVGPKLSQIDSILTGIQLIAVRRDEAEFAMLRTGADGVERSFYILFVRDNDGIWRLRTF